MKEFVIFLDHGSYNLPDISNVTTYSSGIANLKYLEVEIMYDIRWQNTIKILSILSKVCNGIVRFKLWMLQTNKENITPILDIIKSQPINNMSIHYTPTYEYLEEIIIYISKFRSKTFTRLIFNRANFKKINFLLISKLKPLEYLKIIYCNNFTVKHCEEKEFNLKGLTWFHGKTDNDLLQVIVMINSLCSETLIELSSNVTTFETMKIIRNSCPNINILKFDLLRYFEYFTNNCKANLKKLSINLYSGNPLRKNFLKCIDNYQRVHNSLKILEFKQYEINWSNEEREIVKSLENQGICLKCLED
ncbi:unnamed protein product [Rhizophagus irregularis]|uniref:RNI-like protein n=1 Tax=Rhizophagus irregularis TaxID=588596 RepID=A0A2N1MGK0_9GLOM|nr:hypothetical protein RhiirC2_792846 [Rhizophagus irregularis]CAB4395822.1 unnamed protein product [Rhizophagus irregularis]CAB5351962.1 unnamed protein product [Rhizophagus irregularis]